MEANTLMSMAEFGVVFGVALEGLEYIPSIHSRWPILERIGFLILIVALIADWHFQSAINEQNTIDLVAARDQIVELAPRPWLLPDGVMKSIASQLRTFRGQIVTLVIDPRAKGYSNDERAILADRILTILDNAEWRDPTGGPLYIPNAAAGRPQPSTKAFQYSPYRVQPDVFIEIGQNSSSARTKEASLKLRDFLSTAGLKVGWDEGTFISPNAYPSPEKDLIAVFVGEKSMEWFSADRDL